MNGLEEEGMGPQTFLYGCTLEPGKDVVFDPEDEDFAHQLDLKMACVDPSTKDELHMVEVEGQDAEGEKVKAVLASLKPSILPSVCLGDFTITPPAVFHLKCGSGPVHISGQHVIAIDSNVSLDGSDEEEEEEEEEDVKTSKKRPASSPSLKSQKKIKLDKGEDDADDDDDDDEDDEGDEDDDESEAEESPVKAKPASAKKTQNGKSSKPNTPAAKQEKTPKGKAGKSPKTPPTPKAVLTIPEVKAKMMEAVKKGVTLPKIQPKFENFVKNGYKVTEAKDIAELWKWRQSVKDAK